MKQKKQIQGGHSTALQLVKNDSVRVINMEGPQVVDAWAFCLPDLNEFLSTEHTRSCLEKLIPDVGDHLYSNSRNPLLRVEEDTSPGVHDLLLSACDEHRYRLLGHEGYHRNCTDNLYQAMTEIGYTAPEVPSPFNIFENVTISEGGRLSIQPPVVSVGESITLKAERDLILVLSSCPMDIALTNGPDLRSKPFGIEISRF